MSTAQFVSPNDIEAQIGQADRVRHEAVSRLKTAYAYLLRVKAIDGWKTDSTARAMVEKAETEIDAALATITDEKGREAAKGLGMFLGRVDAAAELKRDALSAGQDDLPKLIHRYVLIVEDAIGAKNLKELPYVDEMNGGVQVTEETLKAADSLNQVVIGTGKFVVAQTDGKRRGIRYHAPSFGKSKAVQALVLNLKGAFGKIFDLKNQGFQARKGAAADGDEGDGGQDRTGEREARGYPVVAEALRVAGGKGSKLGRRGKKPSRREREQE